jgi:hypothetical protein
MKHIRISFDDGDPWHLSPVPLIVFVIGVVAFCCGATLFALHGLRWGSAIGLFVGAIASLIGGVGMVREHLSQAAVMDREIDEKRGHGV